MKSKKCKRGISSAGIRILGFSLIVLGFLITSFAFFSRGTDGEGPVIVFPSISGNVGGWAMFLISLLFIAFFLSTIFLPWIEFYRGRETGLKPLSWRQIPRESEEMEYMITINVPTPLKKTVFIEEDRNTLHLKSSSDRFFHRKYVLPEGFDVDGFDYEYEDDFLVMRLKLKKNI
jgi:hypothetical protein